MKAVILAGGLGTRLREQVKNVPKPMAPIAEKPFLEYLLDHLISFDITDIILSVGYLSHSIIDHFGNSFKTAQINYTLEDEPLGTGGAILKASLEISNEPFLVLNGDTFLNLNYHKFINWYQENPNDLSMVLRSVPDTFRFDSIQCKKDTITAIHGKGIKEPGLINAGIYIIKPNLFKKTKLNNRFSFEEDFLKKYCKDLNPRAYISSDYFIDIGIPDDYALAQTDLPKLIN